MSEYNNVIVNMTKKQSDNELFGQVKCKSNNNENKSSQQLFNGINITQTAASAKEENTHVKNKFENIEHILHDNIDIKADNVETDPASDTSSGYEKMPAMVEFIEIKDVKIEKSDELNNEENVSDSVKMNEGSFICNVCKSAFTIEEFCKNHQKRCYKIVNVQQQTSTDKSKDAVLSNKQRLYECDKCEEKFKLIDELDAHLRTHLEIDLHACNLCQKEFITAQFLTAHMLSHVKRKNSHECSFCGRTFNTADYLKVHIRSHTGDRPYKCSECNKSFVALGRLTVHMRRHTGERPYSCRKCCKSFPYLNSMKIHLRTHTGDKIKSSIS